MKKLTLFSFLLFVCCLWVTFSYFFLPMGTAKFVAVVPDFVGQAADTAVFPDWIEPETEFRADAETEPGTVLSQSPAAGTTFTATAGSPRCRIRLTVSTGRVSP